MLQDSATPKMVRNVIDGTTPPQKIVGSYEQLEDGTYNLIIGLTGDAPSAAAITQINGEEIKLGGGAKLDEHPIGSLWISSDATSPAAIMGGSWEQVQDVFPLFAGTNYEAGSTGGSAEHLHGLNNAIAGIMLNVDRLNYADRNFSAGWTATRTYGKIQTEDVSYGGLGSGAPLFGNTDAMSNMPPYRTFYCWERIA